MARAVMLCVPREALSACLVAVWAHSPVLCLGLCGLGADAPHARTADTQGGLPPCLAVMDLLDASGPCDACFRFGQRVGNLVQDGVQNVLIAEDIEELSREIDDATAELGIGVPEASAAHPCIAVCFDESDLPVHQLVFVEKVSGQ